MQVEKSQTLGSTDNAGNSVNLVSGIIRFTLGVGFLSASESDDRFYLPFLVRGDNSIGSDYITCLRRETTFGF